MTTQPEVLQERLRQQLERRRINRLVGDGGLGGRFGLVAPQVQARKRGLVRELPIAMPEPLTSGGQVIASGQLLVMSATADPIAAGSDYVEFDTIVAQHAFPDVIAAGASWTHSVGGIYILTVKLGWASYLNGGTIRLELDGIDIPEGLVVEGTSGSEAIGVLAYRAEAGSVGKLKVAHSSASAQVCNARVGIALSDPDPVAAAAYSSYADAVLADGPVAYWRLDESSGPAADETGNGHTGTYAGTFTLGAVGVMRDGSGSTALSLAGGDSVSGVAGADWATVEFTGTAAFSVECWFQTDDPAVVQILVQKQVVTSGAGWELVLLANGSVAFARVGTGGATVTSPAGVITAGTRFHVVATYDGTTMRIYLDGTEVGSTASAHSMSSNSVPLTIGYDPEGGNQFTFDGVIDEVAIYDRAITGAEIAEHYDLGTQV